MLAVDRDVKPRNMNFAKVEKRGGGINREGAFIAINTVLLKVFDPKSGTYVVYCHYLKKPGNRYSAVTAISLAATRGKSF